MHADLILLTVIAVVILLWLKNIVGTRRGNNEPLQAPKKTVSKSSKAKPRTASPKTHAEERLAMLKPLSKHPAVDNKTAEVGLVSISSADQNFDIDHFITGARGAFDIIVTAFAKGERDILKPLLAKPVYDAFSKEITARNRRKETVETLIHDIEKTMITEARMEKDTAMIAVKFTALETCVIRDKEDKIIAGDPVKKNILNDVWVFSRDLKGSSPIWLLSETRDDEVEAHTKTPLPEAK